MNLARRSLPNALALAFSLALVARAFGQGSLTPPPGAPAPVMKTLQEVFEKAAFVEAQNNTQSTQLNAIQSKQNGVPNRIPLIAGQPGVTVDVNGAITISFPGSYFLTGNLNVESATHGITVASADVTLDLNGFAVRRLTGTGGSGVLISGYYPGVHVRNGAISGGTTVGSGGAFVLAGWTNAVSFAGVITPPTCRLSDLRVAGTRAVGLNAERGTAERCTVETCGGIGIYAHTVIDCTVRFANGSGIFTGSASGGSVTNSYGESIGLDGGLSGIDAPNGTVTNSRGFGQGSGFGIQAERATDSYGYAPAGTGLYAYQSALNCGGRSDTGGGLFAILATNCHGTSSSGIGLSAATANNCYGVSSSGAAGLRAQGTASFCRGERLFGTAIDAGIAIGCTALGGTIVSSQKHLGTP
ncbi:MAG: hypothetical protein JSR82_11605 [Verrucomicrobia bacterium]|nr:hypothetical protein [Verrucomicrobiota bacterium]